MTQTEYAHMNKKKTGLLRICLDVSMGTSSCWLYKLTFKENVIHQG
jgi:hypothetical protein